MMLAAKGPSHGSRDGPPLLALCLKVHPPALHTAIWRSSAHWRPMQALQYHRASDLWPTGGSPPAPYAQLVSSSLRAGAASGSLHAHADSQESKQTTEPVRQKPA